jgi:hypothetical protein
VHCLAGVVLHTPGIFHRPPESQLNDLHNGAALSDKILNLLKGWGHEVRIF